MVTEEVASEVRAGPTSGPGHHRHLFSDPSLPELCLRLYGPLQLTNAGQRVKLSARAALLLAHLALEGPLHRAAAARLLWPHAGRAGLRNLRVELSALRRQGVDLSPGRSPLLQLHARTDLHGPERHGPPLDALGDLGEPGVGDWIAQQRLRLLPQPGALPGALPSAPDEAAVLEGLAAQIRPELARALAVRGRAQLRLYLGRPGSGRRETLRRALGGLEVAVVDLAAGPDLLDLHGALLHGLQEALGAPALHDAPEAQPGLAGLVALRQAATRLLRAHTGRLAVVLHDAERLSADSSALVDFLLGAPGGVLTVAVTTPAHEGAVEAHLGRHLRPGAFAALPAPPLTPAALPTPAGADPLAWADRRWEALRQTEGWLPALTDPRVWAAPPPRARLPDDLQRALRAEVAALGLDVPALALLAGRPGPWSEARACAALEAAGRAPTAARNLLDLALRGGVLERVPDVLELDAGGEPRRVPDGPHRLGFTSELQRAALAATLDAAQRAAQRSGPGAGTWAPPAGPPQPLTRVAGPPLSADPATRTVRLPGGYHAHLPAAGAGPLTLLRLGAPGHGAPTLLLRPPPGATGVLLRLVHDRGDAPEAAHLWTPALGPLPWQEALIPGVWHAAAVPPGGALAVRATDVLLQVQWHVGR